MQKKSSVKQTMNMFEPQAPPAAEGKFEDHSSEALKIVDACPRCGGRSQKSVRPQEYGGLTHYCSVCKGDEAGEPFRFTPEVATPPEPQR